VDTNQHDFNQSSIHVQLQIHSHKHEKAKIRAKRLARFSLYNLPAWLKTRSDGAHVAVIPSSWAAAFR